jgi:catalase
VAKSKCSNRTSAAIHDQKPDHGEGGELHQIAAGDVPLLTMAQGGPVSDDPNSPWENCVFGAASRT